MCPRTQKSFSVMSLKPDDHVLAGSMWTIPVSISNSCRCGFTARISSIPASGLVEVERQPADRRVGQLAGGRPRLDAGRCSSSTDPTRSLPASAAVR